MLKTTVRIPSAPMLVIESIPLVAPLLRETAGADNSLIQVAATGTEALALLRNFAPQLVLADMVLPDMSGLQLLSALKPLIAGAPVLCLASANDEIDIDRGLELGAEDFLFKPFRPQVLERRIRQLLAPEESPEARLAPLPSHKNLYSLPRRVAALPAPDSRRPGTGLALWLQTRSFQLASK